MTRSPTNMVSRCSELIYTMMAAAQSSSIARWAPLPLRLITGYGFAAHGFAKLFRGAGDFTALLHTLGMPAPALFAWLTIVTEIVGGLSMLLGALVPLISIPMVIVLVVAIVTVHWQYGFSSIKLQAITPHGAHFGEPGYETDLLYLACIAGLVLGGAGPFAIDNWLKRRFESRMVNSSWADTNETPVSDVTQRRRIET
jgi:putative oxidoreductase